MPIKLCKNTSGFDMSFSCFDLGIYDLALFFTPLKRSHLQSKVMNLISKVMNLISIASTKDGLSF